MAMDTSWHMRGDVMEACNCVTSCPCNFGSEATEDTCETILAWHIEEGTFGQTRLDGLNVVFYARMPKKLFEGGWTAGIYLDQRAAPEQVQALGTIFSGQAGGWPAALSGLIAHQLEPKLVPISIESGNGDRRITVPGLLEVGTERMPNPMPGQPPLDPKVTDLAVPFYTGPARVRRSSTLKLTDPNMSFEHSGRSSLIGHFEYNGP